MDQGGHQADSDSDSTEPLNTEDHLKEEEAEEDLKEGNSEQNSLEEARWRTGFLDGCPLLSRTR